MTLDETISEAEERFQNLRAEAYRLAAEADRMNQVVEWLKATRQAMDKMKEMDTEIKRMSADIDEQNRIIMELGEAPVEGENNAEDDTGDREDPAPQKR